jgi:enoyl-CoA hydratase/carnithine racemase
MFKHILYTVDGPAATITLNRPAQLNAWTETMGNEVREAFALAERDQAVVGIILTGAERAFCAGADLGLLESILAKGDLRQKDSPMPGDRDSIADYRQTYSYIASLRKPVIAAIHGACVGMAVPIALFCDLRFVSEQAFFMTAFSQRGLVAEWGSSWLLPRMVGNAHALDMLFSSRRVYGQEAVTMGLANRVIQADELLAEARNYIGELAKNCSPLSMAIIKRQLYQDWMQSLEQAQQEAGKLMLESFSSENFQEGVSSIMEKRPPKFPPLKIDR